MHSLAKVLRRRTKYETRDIEKKNITPGYNLSSEIASAEPKENRMTLDGIKHATDSCVGAQDCALCTRTAAVCNASNLVPPPLCHRE